MVQLCASGPFAELPNFAVRSPDGAGDEIGWVGLIGMWRT